MLSFVLFCVLQTTHTAKKNPYLIIKILELIAWSITPSNVAEAGTELNLICCKILEDMVDAVM